MRSESRINTSKRKRSKSNTAHSIACSPILEMLSATTWLVRPSSPHISFQIAHLSCLAKKKLVKLLVWRTLSNFFKRRNSRQQNYFSCATSILNPATCIRLSKVKISIALNFSKSLAKIWQWSSSKEYKSFPDNTFKLIWNKWSLMWTTRNRNSSSWTFSRCHLWSNT